MTPKDDSDSGGAGAQSMPGERTSLWLGTTPETDYGPLDGGAAVDTAVIGGGIVGLTAATLLAEAGQRVAVLERGRILEGVTGKTTAKLTSQHGLLYDTLVSSFGERRARQYARANEAAKEHVAERVEREGIDCGFRRLPAYTYVDSPEKKRKVKREVEAARKVGLPAEYAESLPLDADAAAAVRFDDQAQFHPREYLLSLAASLTENGGRIYEDTRALDIDDGRRCRVSTDRGEVRADAVVVATHFPMSDPALYFARMHPKRSYVLAARVDDPPREGMFYRTGRQYFSVRTHEIDGETLTLVGGQNHKTGQGGDTSKRYRKLEQAARRHFDVQSIEYRWSTQDYVSVDKVPYVGKIGPTARNVYVGTGFGGWGMTSGTAAGMILSDLIRGDGNPWAEVFDPARVTLGPSAREFATQNANVAKEFVGDWLTKPLGNDLRNLPRGEAKVSRKGGEPVAAYRDEGGELHAVSAVCPHMYCVLEWNDGERTWDCPCHGSRFGYDGHVIDGPAVRDLPTRDAE
ncbi:FAD-dependent oxidoreductase [Halegenticoccus soli]|uniref:FAD-dependent oxidoreductase n=1 Tax=Halegenticoccus soli TaxID=1985678 RepID=UPI000C6D9849|nr:FAD-dependent oxidoreductase [Halegenticoccus soli]